jgi:hypothetical protein
MKKWYFIFFFFVFCCIGAFGNDDKQEEVDFLLFLPNSSNLFVDEKQTFLLLDNLAHYLSNKNLIPGQIVVCGYAAFAPNDIGDADLSRERAVFVINELQKRGVSKDLFSDPVGYGSVNLWGNNTDEDDRRFNRRVRVLLDGESPLLITQEILNSEIETVIPASVYEGSITQEGIPEKSSCKFPWWLLLALLILMLIAALIFLLRKKRSRKPVNKNETVAVPVFVPVPAAAVTTSTVNLDEEIRLCAYEFYQRRNEWDGNRDQDWHNAVREVSARYTACGHSVYMEDGYWWASRSYSS